MNKLNRKQMMVGRETMKYLPYKSYRNDDNNLRKIQKQSQDEIKSSESSTKVKKSSKLNPESTKRQISAYRGDNAVHCVNSGNMIKSILKHSESQRSDASSRVYKQLKNDLALLQEVKCQQDEEILRLKADTESLHYANNELRRINEELQDQYELNSDQIKELLISNERKTEQLRQLESNICNFQSDKDTTNLRMEELEHSNRELENSNKELMNLISELHSVTEEKDRVFDHLTGIWNIRENYPNKALKTKKDDSTLRMMAINDDDAKVILLETNTSVMQHTNGEQTMLKNKYPQKSLVERKQYGRHLHQKCDELKKHRTRMEKSTNNNSLFDCIDDKEGGTSSSINSRKGTRKNESSGVSSSSHRCTR